LDLTAANDTTDQHQTDRPRSDQHRVVGGAATVLSAATAPDRAEPAVPAAPVHPGQRRHLAKAFRPDIEGMRAVAIVAVLLYHAGLISGGFVGVDVFFVVSGFLITGLLWGELDRTGRVSFAGFYGRRARRLLPASVVVLTATVAASIHWLAPLASRSVAKDAMAAAAYVANLRFATLRTNYLGGGSGLSPLQHYWSLAVEEQFYLVWPMVLALASLAWRGRPGRGAHSPGSTGRTGSGARPSRAGATVALSVIFVTSLAASVYVTRVAQPWAFFSLPTRAWELAAGGLVALTRPALSRVSRSTATALGWAGMAAVVYACLAFDGRTAFPGTAAMVPVLGTAAVIAAGCAAPRRGVSRGLSNQALQRVGALSYSWYLWHFPVLVLAPHVVGHKLSVAENLVLAVASGGLAAVTAAVVENPARFSARLSARPLRSLAFGAGLTATAVLVAAVGAAAVPSARGTGHADAPATLHASRQRQHADPGAVPPGLLGDIQTALAAGAAQKKVPAKLTPSLARARDDAAAPFADGCNDGYPEVVVRPCVYANPGAAVSVFAFGDSHAAQWFPALDQSAKERGWRLTSVTKATCVPMAVPTWSPILGHWYKECDAFRAKALARIRAERPSVVVVDVARHYGADYRIHVYDKQWTDALGALVRKLRAAGSQVVVLGPSPKPGNDVPVCLSNHLRAVPLCQTPRAAAVNQAGEDAERAAVARAGGVYVDVASLACQQAGCPVVLGNILMYRDDNHFTTTFANWLTPAVTAVLDQVLARRR
jgi:peptidoglycan/LPS O-acetylase OafA/YrhL